MSHPESVLQVQQGKGTFTKGRMLVLILLSVLGIWFLIDSALPYFNVNEEVFGRYWPNRAWLIVHVSVGTIAMLVGLFQLWSGLATTKMSIHPWTGRIYCIAIFLGALSAFVLASSAFETVGFTFASGLAGLGVAWLMTTGLALVSIRRNLLSQHKEWMVRSYVVTFGFVSFRLFTLITGSLEIGDGLARISTASWFCWAVPLLLAEGFIQGRKIFGSTS